MSALLAHSPLGASSYARWSACPGSVRLSRNIVSASSPYAEEGTAAHAAAEYCLSNRLRCEVGDVVDLDDAGQVTFTIDEAVRLYVHQVLDDFEAKKGNELFIEQRFYLTSIDEGMFGTNDAAILSTDNHLRIYDYKHGAGVGVEVENNGQLIYYAAGAIDQIWKEKRRAVQSCELIIVQPRREHEDGYVRAWPIDPLDIIDWKSEALDAIKRTRDPNAPLIAGTHCRWCPAAPRCPKLHSNAQEVAKAAFAEFTAPPAPALLTIEQLTKVLDRADQVRNWLQAVEDYAQLTIVNGGAVPGYKVVDKRAIRKWKDEPATAAFAQRTLHLKPGDIFDMKLKSPAQLEKLLPKSERSLLEDLVSKESSGVTLAPESDKRPAAIRLPAASVFSEIIESNRST